jgi:hypothetical protein
MKLPFGFRLDLCRDASASEFAVGAVQDGARNPRIIDASKAPDYMGPGDALQAMAPLEAVKGRAFDYPVGYNMQTVPRGESWSDNQASMQQLRFLADAGEIIRILIETRKDQLCALNWRFRKRSSKQVDGSDPGVKFLEKFFAMPDRENDFDTWLRMIVEDLCVLDAPAIHVSRFTDSVNYGKVAALEPIDGATIKCLMDEHGRRPAAPLAAYAHILKGIPAIHYSSWDLIYSPRNRRTHCQYGFGPVEQIKTYISTMIRRQVLQLGYFTEGNAPDCIIPMKGTADQVSKFQATFDAQTMGGQKTGKMIFVPSDNVDKILFTKDNILVDKFDEWLARIACATFSESPTPYVSQVNRATAETAQYAATREGLHVQIKHITNIINGSIIRHQMMLNMPDYEIYVAPEPLTDLEKVSAIALPAVAGGIMRVDEARDMMGLTGEAPAQPATNPQQAQVGEKTAQVDEQEQARQSVGRMVRAASAAEASRTKAMCHETALADKVGGWLQRMAAKVGKRMGQARRSDGDDPMDVITGSDLDEFSRIVEGSLESIATDSSLDAAASFLAGQDLSSVRAHLRDNAAAAARERGAWLVGRRLDEDGNVVAAARPEYSITEEMRESIRMVTAEAAEGSWTTETITEALQESAGFARSRAATIARTEIVNAHEQGKLSGWKAAEAASGAHLVKRSILGSNDNHAKECILNAAQGYIPVGSEFQSGDVGAPYHPNCMCTTVARKASKGEA